MKTTITAEELIELGACEDEFPKYLNEFGEEPAKFSEVFKHMGWDSFWWGICRIQNNLSEFQLNGLRLLSCDYAESVIHLYESEFDDDRPRKSIEAGRAYARGEISKKKMASAWAAARASAWDAGDAGAAGAAAKAAGDTAKASARAAEAAAKASARAAGAAARDAAKASAWDAAKAAGAAARTNQEKLLLDLLLTWESLHEK